MDDATFRGLVRVLAALSGILLIATGCRSTPQAPSLAPPALSVQVEHFAGTLLSKSSPQAAQTVTLQNAATVRVSWYALQGMPSGDFKPLGTQVRLIAATRGGVPVLPSARLTQAARIALLDESSDPKMEGFDRNVPVTSLTGSLADGVTVGFRLSDVGLAPARRIELQIHRGPAAAGKPSMLQLALIVEDMVASPAAEPAKETDDDRGPAKSPPADATPKIRQRELVLLDDLPLPPGKQWAVAIPYAFTNAPGGALAAIIEIIADPGDPAHTETITRCQADLKRSADAAAGGSKSPGRDGIDWPGFQSAIASLPWNSGRRAALVFLSNQCGARVCEDLALAGDDPALAELSTQIVLRTQEALAAQDKAKLSWALDVASLEFLAQAQASARPAPELLSVLLRHTGQVGRSPASMEEVLQGVASREDLNRRLVAENYIFLEDSSPSARVRAFDWLQSRGQAPAGYEPMAPMKERRAALEKALLGATAAQPAGVKP